ncbi:MAG: transcription-repair coupling factor, partial [Gammaproteobacteria bacterium]|nr:transcription-repair coupling factor [Gammaproteobacteria bacterium]
MSSTADVTNHPSFFHRIKDALPTAAGKHVVWGQLYGSSDSYALAQAALADQGLFVIIVNSNREQERFAKEIAFFAPSVDVYELPAWETLAYDQFSPHADIVSQRLATLAKLPNVKHGIVLVTLDGIMQRLSPRAHVDASQLKLTTDSKIDHQQLRQTLDQLGYIKVSQVHEPGEFAIRGHLIDVFPMGQHTPFRIDLLDDDIESIRRFDPDTQRSIKTLDQVQLLPAREYPFNPGA